MPRGPVTGVERLHALATDEDARGKAREAFSAHTVQSASLDVLERCKKLNEFLSQV